MLLSIINLLLLEQRWILLIAGVVILLIAIWLVAYFRRRLKTVEKEPEEDWQAGMHSIFAAPTTRAQPSVEPLPVEEIEMAEAEIGTRPLASGPELNESAAIEAEPERISRPEPEAEQWHAVDEPPVIEEPSVAEKTRMLYSEPRADNRADEDAKQLETDVARTEAANEAALFDDEVWEQLNDTKPHTNEPVVEQQIEQQVEPEAPPSEFIEPQRVARVEQRAPREPFEPPRVKPMSHREPFEPPRIEPLTPRQQDDFMREREATEPPAERRVTEELRSAPASPPVQPEPLSDRDDDIAYVSAAEDRQPAPTAVAASVDAARARRAPAGSVLGLPAEPGDKPLVLGEPVRDEEETGIGALSRYGKKTNEKTSHVGTTILIAVVLLIGGIVAAYFLVPQFHEWVNTKYAGLRGSRAQENTGPKARIIGYPVSIVNKAGKATGVVENISTETLEGLTIEVSLQRFDRTTAETRVVPIVPGTLGPNELGKFEFDFPTEDPGVNRYVITKLMSNDRQILFASNN